MIRPNVDVGQQGTWHHMKGHVHSPAILIKPDAVYKQACPWILVSTAGYATKIIQRRWEDINEKGKMFIRLISIYCGWK